MAPTMTPSAPLLRSLRSLAIDGSTNNGIRLLSTSASVKEQAQVRTSFNQNPNPETVYNPRLERKLTKAGTPPIGSRRRRMALAVSQNISFDQLPYQCFQEARQVLIADRGEKIKQINVERARIARVQETDGNTFRGGEQFKQKRLLAMREELERLKILADINDPNVKRRFEDGKGDMSKPIYRFLADRKWREYQRKILVQRIAQMKVVPDVIPHCNSIVDIKIMFGRRNIQPGDFVDSKLSEQVCQLRVQSFDKEERLVTIAIVDPDVPDLKSDTFSTSCHYLASNIPLSATAPLINLTNLTQNQSILQWVPPTAQKGSPYHRLAIVVFQQKNNTTLDVDMASKKVQQSNFSARSFMTHHMLHPIGATLFRTKWDENTAEVMTRAGIDGAGMELKRTKVEPLPYKRRNPSTFR